MATQFPDSIYTHDASECTVTGDDIYAFSTICESHFPANLLNCITEPRHPPLLHSTYWHKGAIKELHPNSNSTVWPYTNNNNTPSIAPITSDAINAKHVSVTRNGESIPYHSYHPHIYDGVLASEPPTKRVYSHMPRARIQHQGAHEGLDAMTRKVIETLQICGKATFYELHKLTGVDTRRLYDITNLLASTPFVSKAGRKRERAPFIFGDGSTTDNPVEIEHILLDIELEQMKILTLLDTFNRRSKEGGQLMFTC